MYDISNREACSKFTKPVETTLAQLEVLAIAAKVNQTPENKKAIHAKVSTLQMQMIKLIANRKNLKAACAAN